MTVLGTGISWTNSTWNLAIGCTKVSAGCDHCYAEGLVNRLSSFRQRFDEVRLKLERLSDVRKFRPLVADDGLNPHLVFVNSMSDFWHSDIPDDAIFKILDVMEANPHIVFQVLTKRPIRARKVLTSRYPTGIPRHIWIGVTAEDNQVKRRLDIMRSIKERCGGGTFFASVEPIVGPTNELDFSGMDWIITGGESGPGARRMQRDWLMSSVSQAVTAEIPLWHKQSGTIASHPNIHQVPSRLKTPSDKMRWLCDHGWELLPKEKGGATIDKWTFRQLPAVFDEMKKDLNAKAGLSW